MVCELAVSATTTAAAQGSRSYAVNTYVNDVEISPYVGYLDDFPFRVAESGGTEPATAEIAILDKTNILSRVTDEAYVRVQRSGVDLFRGFIRSRRPRIATIGRIISCSATDVSSLLDSTIVVSNQRAAGESDSDRIKYFLATYASQSLLSGSIGSSDLSKIQTLKASMGKQNFKYLTLRQAIERILGSASPSSNYYLDASGRLHTFDSDHPENDTAPYDINVTLSPSATEAAPENLTIDFDTQSLVNFYYVRGANAAGSGPFSNATSISLFGRRSAFIDGPDSRTASDASDLGNAALRDTAYPVARGSFALHAPYDARNGKSWRAGQVVTVTSPQHGISAKEYRVLKVTTEFMDGEGNRKVEIEFGGLRLRLRGGSGGNSATNSVGASVQGSIG